METNEKQPEVKRPETPEHFHSYQRMDSRKEYFRCLHPDCMSIYQKELLVGKRARCPKCLKLYIVTARMLRTLKTLHCIECGDSRRFGRDPEAKKAVMEIDIEEKLKKILGA